MIRFPVNAGYAKYPSASFLNGLSSFSVVATVRFASIDSARAQRVFRHAGATNQISLRKVVTTDRWYASTTVGGALVTCSPGTVLTAGTLYHVVMTWEKNNATGLKLYVDGVFSLSASTTTQTVDYDSGDAAAALHLASASDTSDKGLVDLEGFTFFPNYLLSAVEVAALRFAGWPGLLALPKPSVMYLFDGRLLAEIPDVSGNGRHITSANIFGAVSDQAMQGKWEREPGGGFYLHSAVAGAAPGPPAPNPWTKYPTTTPHPATQVILSGLTPDGVYEMYLTALDAAGNESAPSNVVEATARESVVVHTEKRVFLGHAA